nr:MAG TPA: holin protein [Caudoviricetes sp.]
MKELMIQTYLIVLPIILTALMGYIVWLLQEQRKQKIADAKERNDRIAKEAEERLANSKGTMLLLRVQLIEYHDRYIAQGSIPSYAYQNFCEMYEAYHELGGNGMITKMMHEIEELHLKKKEKER